MTIDPAANTGSAECHASIVITGFSGTGKNTVGRIVARKLGREFVDLDEAIATREGKTVREIFETCGEAYFRDCEEMVCAELAEHLDLVIATGGGTLANPRNHDAFEQTWVVCLDASVDSIVARLKDAKDRPLLATGTLREGVENLLQARTPVYAQLGKHVDTTDKCPEQVAEEIVAAFPHQHRTTGETGNRAPVRSFPAGAHPILLGPGLLEQVGTWLEESSAGVFSTPCAIITNPRVRALYGDQVVTSLAANHFVPNVILIPEGEKYKTLQTASQVYDRLIDAQLDRRSAIFALGGGVVGDLAGFVAATFLRGVPLIHLPTTLLAMVDASIGGKVGVDHPRGKNLVGAFKLPQAVIVDIETLKTLPDAEFRAGLSEVVKHAIIGDVGLFGWLEKRAAAIRSGALETAYLERAMRVKVDIVVHDPLEAGVRARLNLGHTFAHALEKVSGYEMRHGEAVSIGLVCATRLAVRISLCDGTLLTRVSALLKALQLPTHVPRSMSSSEILDAMGTDKKRVGTRWRFVLPCELGDVRVAGQVACEDVRLAIEEGMGP